LACLLSFSLTTQLAAQSASKFDVIKYTAQIEPNFDEQSISGSVQIRLRLTVEDLEEIQLDAGSLQIDSVREKDQELVFDKVGTQLRIELAESSSDQEIELEIDYHGSPSFGINWGGDLSSNEVEISTAFSTSQWLPSVDAPSERATLDLSLILPAEFSTDFKVVANGSLISQQKFADGRLVSNWLLESPSPAYLFGFVAGKFREVVDRTQAPVLRYLAPGTFSAGQLRQIFRDTRDMIEFFEDKSGIPYPAEQYSQVLLRKGNGQEMIGFSVMGERYGRRVLDDETAIWLSAHEVAHQWWGNQVTNAGWEHFWLNEGIGSFMTDAYLEHRFGPETYMTQFNAARSQYGKLRDSGNDKPLVFPNWDRPTAEDRSIVYDKGSYVTHLLRRLLGEEAFWSALQSYTQRYWGRSVTTKDFQRAMEESSGQNLSEFFGRWVY